MSFNPKQFREWVVRPALQEVTLWSDGAEELLMLTAAQESQLGTYIAQITGPALGVFQMEPATHTDVWRYILSHHNVAKLLPWKAQQRQDQLIWDLRYATVMARIKYYEAPDEIPPSDQISQLAAYWKQWYNTPLGAGKISDAINNYYRYVRGLII